MSSSSVASGKNTTKNETQGKEKDAEQTVAYSGFTPARRKMIITLVTLAGFLGPLAGNVYIPILPLLKAEFHTTTTIINGTVAVFMAVFAVSTLIWAPFADFTGRKGLYIISLSIFLLANVLLTFLPKNIGVLYFLRIVQALGASSVIPVGAGVVSDITPKHSRGKVISIFMLGPQVGPMIGPILSLVATGGNWRWCFGALTIITIVVYLAILLLLPETLRYLVGNGETFETGSWQSWFIVPKLIEKKIVEDNNAFPKPPKPGFKVYIRLFKYVPVLLTSINGGLLFAGLYGLNVSFNEVLKQQFSLSDVHISVSYLCLGAGLVIGSLISGFTSDKFRRLKIKTKNAFIPESRVPLQLVGFLLTIIGLTCFGWCCQKRFHICSIYITGFISCFGISWVLVTNTTYLTECATGLPATNVAFGNVIRNAAAAICSVIIHELTVKMGYGWCFTGIALVNVVGLINIIILQVKGRAWREKAVINTSHQ